MPTTLEQVVFFATSFYAIMAFMCFSFFFVFLSIFPFPSDGPTGNKYKVWDHFWLCLALSVTWPYGITLLFLKGAKHGPSPRQD